MLGRWTPIDVSGPRDIRIGTIAAEQQGRVSRAQLHAAGIGDSAIYGRVARSYMFRLHAGVFAVGHLAPMPLGDEIAALLACGEGSRLSFRSAGVAWELLPEGLKPELVDVTVVGGKRPRPDGVRVHRTRRFHERDIRIHRGIPITSPARTLLDLAGVLPVRDLERALDEALARGLVRLSQIDETVARAGRGRRGAPVLARLVGHRSRGSGRTRSESEDRFYSMLRAAGLPPPDRNVPLLGFTVDFLWPEHGVAVEIDGCPWHSTKSAFERDHRKDAVMKQAGIDLSRFTGRQVQQEPLAVIAAVARALTEASRR